MFFDLLQSPVKTQVNLRELPPVPPTTWARPQYFPNLITAQVIGLDLETKETDWDNGPGWGRGTGHIIGVSVAAVSRTGERGKWYFPVRHEAEASDNFEPNAVFRWLREQLHTPHIPKVGANFLFDCGWLSTEDIYPQGPLYDVEFAEALIDEEAFVALEILGRKYLGRGKAADLCKDWIFRAFPKATEKTWRSYLWQCPPRLVGMYAEDDADMPLDVLWKQWDILRAEGTLDLFRMECRQIPMLVKMRLQGIPVDLDYAEQLRGEIIAETKDLYAALRHDYAVPIESVTAPSQLTKLFDAAGVPYPKTAAGRPSFKKEWLKELDNPLGVAINDIREREKLVGTFLDKYILGRVRRDSGTLNRGRIYCSFHPLRGDTNGAKTGRFASSDPNLQNIPARTKLGKKIRKIVIPELGHAGYHKKDHSQIEYRMLAHYAVGSGSDELRHRYASDPATDYHHDTMLAVAPILGKDLASMTKEEIDLFRKPIKNINFGLLYGQQAVSLAYKAGMPMNEATKFVEVYHSTRPFVKATMNAIQSEVQQLGYMSTLLNRRTRFHRWESMDYEKRGASTSYDAAIREFGPAIRRAFAYRAVNYRFQGSAADILKLGMLQCYEQGVYDYIGFPKLTVHDELDWSKINDTPAMNDAFRYATHVLETCMPGLRVPLKVDSTEGATWGDCA